MYYLIVFKIKNTYSIIFKKKLTYIYNTSDPVLCFYYLLTKTNFFESKNIMFFDKIYRIL